MNVLIVFLLKNHFDHIWLTIPYTYETREKRSKYAYFLKKISELKKRDQVSYLGPDFILKNTDTH